MKIKVFNESGLPVIGLVMAFRNLGYDATLVPHGVLWRAMLLWNEEASEENKAKVVYVGKDKAKKIEADAGYWPPHCECGIFRKAKKLLEELECR